MTEILYLDSSSNKSISQNISSYQKLIVNNSTVTHSDNFTDLINCLIEKGSREYDDDHPLVIIINPLNCNNNNDDSNLNLLSYNDQISLIETFFSSRFNLIILKVNDLIIDKDFESLNKLITNITEQISHRIKRVNIWSGTNLNNQAKVQDLKSIPSLSNFISKVLINSPNENENFRYFANLLIENIDFSKFFKISTIRKVFLIHCIGHWNFPAHDLSNLDLQYCCFLMLKHSLNQVKESDELFQLKPNDNKLLQLIFQIRDSYKAGNPFHNFRHAVDVLQATFYYLIKLNCLPKFKEFCEDFNEEIAFDNFINSNENSSGDNIKSTNVQIDYDPSYGNFQSSNLLSPDETLALLVAAIGHDVGHPGTTNAFMIKHQSPIASIFNERSVLESFHSTAFNKILSINWPINSNQHTKNIIISSILATDMSEHFEYINKIKDFNNETINTSDKLKIICSLLIKCADISNVTRPLKVSSKWGIALSREFNEILLLETYLDNNEDYEKIKDFNNNNSDIFEADLNQLLFENPSLPKGQIFFIDNFASSLFKSVVEIFPELSFTWEIIQRNRAFWSNIVDSSNI